MGSRHPKAGPLSLEAAFHCHLLLVIVLSELKTPPLALLRFENSFNHFFKPNKNTPAFVHLIIVNSKLVRTCVLDFPCSCPSPA